jgi:hypothetical protein
LKYKTWKCGLCGETVIEGQRFLFIRDIGFAHFECVVEKLTRNLENVNRDLTALLDANEVITYSIIRLKDAEAKASDQEIKNLLIGVRKELEKYSAQLSSGLSKYLKEAA